jgi:hypothetical protein
MADTIPEFETVMAMALQLSPIDKLRLMARLSSVLQANLPLEPTPMDNPLLKMADSARQLSLSADRDDISENFDDELRAALRPIYNPTQRCQPR